MAGRTMSLRQGAPFHQVWAFSSHGLKVTMEITARLSRLSSSRPFSLEGSEPLRAAAAADPDAMSELLAAADRVYRRISVALERVGLSYREFRMLTRIRAEEGAGGALRAGQVRAGGSDAGEVVGELIAGGLVDPGRSARLTREGARVVEQAAAGVEGISTWFSAGLQPAEREQLERLLARAARTGEGRGDPSASHARSSQPLE